MSYKRKLLTGKHPYAITMWDFSWLERRWPGAGYEDWDVALDELVERGYNAVRIEAYPHLIWIDPEKVWSLKPVWTTQVWGAPAPCQVQVQPNLNIFIRKCAQRGIKVGLSTWMRQDIDDSFSKIKTPEDLAKMWEVTLATIDEDLMEHILYVDLCNELPIKLYTPFLPEEIDRNRSHEPMQRWMKDSIEGLRTVYPDIPMTISSAMLPDWDKEDNSYMDLIDPHIWMSSGEFYGKIGYSYQLHDPVGYENVQKYAKKLYLEDKAYWQKNLAEKIEAVIAYSKEHNLPVMTTECWAITDYKDWPMLDWDWVKELCEIGTVKAAESGRWNAVSTSNFCGPQFVGMWRDVEWHKKLTDIIKSAVIDEELC